MGKRRDRILTQRKVSRPLWRRALIPGGVAFLGVALVAGLVWAGRPQGEGAAALGGGAASEGVNIFYGSACHDCPPYTEQQAMPALRTRSWSGPIEVHDFLKPRERELLTKMITEIGLTSTPPEVGSALAPATFHIAVLNLGTSRVVLLGHPPDSLIRQVLAHEGLPPRLVVSQEEMHIADVAATKYELWDFQGRVASFPITTPLKEALARMSASR